MRLAAINLRLQTLHSLAYRYGVPDNSELHVAIHELLDLSITAHNEDVLPSGIAAHIRELNQQVDEAKESVRTARQIIDEFVQCDSTKREDGTLISQARDWLAQEKS